MTLVVDVDAREVPTVEEGTVCGGDLVLTPHPLTLAGRTVKTVTFGSRCTLADVLAMHGVDVSRGDWVVTIGGYQVPMEMLHRTRPKHGQLIECRPRPGRDLVRAALFIVLAYYTMGQGATWISASGFWATAGYTAAFMIGAAVINRMLPPSRQRLPTYDAASQSSTYSLAGGRNRARPFEPLGLVVGVVKVVPDYAAQPYTWFDGDEQYQALRFCAGVNCKSIADIKIGQTSLASFTDVVESRSGFPSGNTADTDWANVDTVAGATLDATTAPGAWVQRTSSVDTVRFAVDLVAQLYSLGDDGTPTQSTVVVDLEYRLVGAPSWSVWGSVPLISTSTQPVRLTITGPLLSAGQYEVRARKATANVATLRASNVVDWVALKSYQAPTNDTPGYPQYGLRIKASAQLSGVIDELNWIATAGDAPVWNGSAWVTGATRNPGAQILQLARGIYDPDGRLQAGLGLPDGQIDIEALKGFMLRCTSAGFTCDHWFDQPMSVLDLLEAIANVGMGSISYHSGKLGVVWLESGQPIEAVLNMGNMKAGSFRVDYATRELADELEVTWFDRDEGWAVQSARLLAPGVTVPRQTARYSPTGVTTLAGALRAARLVMAQNVYQRKAISFETDLEHIAFRRFSLIALSHDLTSWGQGGRLKAAADVSGTVTLTLDEAVPSHGTRYIGLRIPGESGWRVFGVNAFSGEARTLTLSTGWPGGVAFPGDSAANPAHDTLWIYDFKAEPGQRLRVVSIEPSNDQQGARVTAVPEPDAFWTYADTGAYTLVAPPPGPGQVVAANIMVAQRLLDINVGNSAELYITFDVSGPFGHAEVWGATQGDALLLLGTTTAPRFGPVIVANVPIYSVEVRPFDTAGRPGTPATWDHELSLGQPLGATLVLTASAVVFSFDTGGTAVPASQTITFVAQLSGLSGTATFTCMRYDADGAPMGLVVLGGSGNTRTLTLAQFANAYRAEVTATLSGHSETVSVNRMVSSVPAGGPVASPGHLVAVTYGTGITEARVEFRADGSIWKHYGAGESQISQWYTGGVPVGYEVRILLDAPNASVSGAVGSWYALTSTRDIKLTSSVTDSASFTYEVRRTSDSVVVGTGTGEVSTIVSFEGGGDG